ncbi:MoaD/ThiS family protein [bacterium]|nr:MoaD/ThiS family protein [bacterium]
MAEVTVSIPGLLSAVTGGPRATAVDAVTVGGALDALFEVYPELRVHVTDESGGIRSHVSCWHGDRRIRGRDDLNRQVSDGDEVIVLQAVSGG